MTQEQKIILDELFEYHKEHCFQNSTYGSAEYCQFIVFENNTNEGIDKNITIVRVEISDLDQNLIPKTRTIHNLIEPNGNVMFLKDFLRKTEIVDYLKILTKIPINNL
jgi:hypothetical protein